MPSPNFVFIYIDDLGQRDLGCYGSTFYETPCLDRLALEGMRFTQAYATCPVCSPSRASILTGQYPARVGVTDWIAWWTQDRDWPDTDHRGRLMDVPYFKRLPAGIPTVAGALRQAGYAAWHVGKWHLGDVGSYPTDHGFDVNIGGHKHGHPNQGYFAPHGFPTMSEGPEGEFLNDRLTDEAIGLIRQNRRETPGKPFFLNLWHYAVHVPIQGKPGDIARFEEKARRLKIDRIDPLVPGELFPTAHQRDQRVMRRVVQSDPVYAALLYNLDWNIGRLMEALEAEGLAQDTIVAFTSDNGGLATAEGSPTCNFPLAEGKGWMYDGGVREPLIVRWPGRVAAGSVSDAVTTGCDFFPTFLEAAGLPLRPGEHKDGVSILPVLTGQGELDREAVFWHYPHYGNQGGTPGSSVRAGDWKLLEFYEDGRLELYNLAEDESEARNLAESRPDIVRRLHKLLADWRKEVEALIPARNPEWRDGSS